MFDKEKIDSWISEIKRGLIELCILSLLREREMYGYEIAKELRSLTSNILAIEEGTLYPLLRRLTKRGFLEEEWRIVDGRPRKYYRLTSSGLVAFEKMKDLWFSITKEVERLLSRGD